MSVNSYEMWHVTFVMSDAFSAWLTVERQELTHYKVIMHRTN